jgi:hypothetical protein
MKEENKSLFTGVLFLLLAVVVIFLVLLVVGAVWVTYISNNSVPSY